MLLIPAIDLKDGRCVRLRQGRMDDATIFSDDPVGMAKHWCEQGGRRLHLVDLDGADSGEPKNQKLIEEIVANVDIPVQIGGGIRHCDVISHYLEAGISQVIIGTQAVKDPQFLSECAMRFPDQIILGLDANDGMLATEGWQETGSTSAVEFARSVAQLPLFAIVFTDIARDGMLSGVNVAATVEIAAASGLPVIASGGVATLEDLTQLLQAPENFFGVITGRGIYEGTLDFRTGQRLLDSKASC
jgi:phosphoribosylformimino-5-aminoimidazole carboxamide ribotide isomerase